MKRKINNNKEQETLITTFSKETKNGIKEKSHKENRGSTSATFTVSVVILAASIMGGLIIYQVKLLHKEQLMAIEKAFIPQNPVLPIRDEKPTVLIWSPRVNLKHLRHVFQVFERIGYQTTDSNVSKWDVLWAHDYPFHVWNDALKVLSPYQKINHFPGTGYVTTKVNLATSGGLHIPAAFKIPDDKDKLMKYVENNRDAIFVEKNNDHRSVELRALSDIDLEASRGSFLQEFVSKPLLISGHKFDIGIYTVITSIDPLRIYKYDGDVLFRFCLQPYEPFNSSNTAQYVIGEDYLPAWQVPDLQVYTDLSYSRREAFDAYIRDTGKDPTVIWKQVDEAISAVYLRKEKLFKDLLTRYRSKRSFFEMVRFDFIMDEDLKVYLLEANMSPNLSSSHYPPNALLYEQVLYSLLSLVGVGNYVHPPLGKESSKEAREMVVADHNIMVYPEKCTSCENCESLYCQLCHPCMTQSLRADLKLAYLEHINRQRCKRIFPPPMTQKQARKEVITQNDLTEKNELMVLWFQGKCILDKSWCQ